MNGATIKLIDKDTDLAKVNMQKLSWDVEVCGKPYEVYRVDEYVHSIGGNFGDNDYWCCPREKKPTVENLIEFSGHVVQWGIEYIPSNYTKYKWGKSEVKKSGKTIIKRNGKIFYSIGSREHEYGLAKAQVALVQIQEHPICFHDQDYMKELIGRKIWLNDQPALIERANVCEEDGIYIWVVPDKSKIEKFIFPRWENTEEESWIGEYENGTKCDILESNIDWFRENDNSS